MSSNLDHETARDETTTTLFCAQSFGLLAFIAFFVSIGVFALAHIMRMSTEASGEPFVAPGWMSIVFGGGLGMMLVFYIGSRIFSHIEGRDDQDQADAR